MQRDVKPRRRLTAERIVDAALDVADADGIDAVSLRRLAASLGVTPMAIYRHVRNKSHLLDLMAERLFERIDIAADATTTWQDRLRRLFGSYLSVANAHPAAPFLLSRPFAAAGEPRVTEALFAAFHDAGFDARQSAQLLQAMSGMILGPALHRAAWATAMREDRSELAREPTVEEPRSADEFPYSTSAAGFLDWSPGPEADRITLDVLVGGLEAIADRPSGAVDLPPDE